MLINKNKIDFLKNDLFENNREISIERALLYTESHKQTNGLPQILRRAKAVEHILENVEISIRDGEVIVGNRTIKPRSGIISPEMDPYWILEEKDTINMRPQDRFVFLEEDKKRFTEELFPYWKDQSMKTFIMSTISSEVLDAMDKEVFKLNQTDKGQGHIIMDFPMVLSRGLGSITSELEEKTRIFPDNLFYQAALLLFRASTAHILRYKKLALDESRMTLDSDRQIELEKIAEICEKISTEKPETFHEALQLIWFVSVIAQYESNASSLSLGRMDQYMYPFYQYSLDHGDTKEELFELLAYFFIKTNDVVLLRSESSAKSFAGFPTGYTVALGGLNSMGHSSVNELSHLFLDVYHEIMLPQPNLSVRMNELIPQDFLNKTCETIRLGTGIPQLFNDEVCIPAFLSKGITLEDARDYAIVGCVEITIPGKMYGLHDIALFNLLRIVELAMYELREDVDVTYEKLYRRIEDDIAKYVKLVVSGSNIVDKGHRLHAPTPFLSTLIDNCLEKGFDVTEGGAKYNFSGVQGIGQANLSDSLYAVKKAVFEEERFSFAELVLMLENNFASKEEEAIRLSLINDYEKYGNDVDDVDFIAANIFKHYAKELDKYKNIREGVFTAGAYTVSAHIPLGEAVGATPDGRRAQEQLADGGLSPMVGRDKLGPTAVLKTVSKLDNYLMTNGSLLNLKFQPSTLKGQVGIDKFSAFLRAYTKLKIQHVQFNVQSRATLLDAQKHPEDYPGLLVRVAGYSAFFTDLNKHIQDDIIARAEHVL